jgi:hypothetical protein
MPRLLPMELNRSYKHPPKTLPRVAGHHADWLQACEGGTPACSNFEYGARLTKFVLLGTLALRTGKVVKWDADGMKRPTLRKRSRSSREATAKVGSAGLADTRGRALVHPDLKAASLLRSQAIRNETVDSRSRILTAPSRGC